MNLSGSQGISQKKWNPK